MAVWNQTTLPIQPTKIMRITLNSRAVSQAMPAIAESSEAITLSLLDRAGLNRAQRAFGYAHYVRRESLSAISRKYGIQTATLERLKKETLRKIARLAVRGIWR